MVSVPPARRTAPRRPRPRDSVRSLSAPERWRGHGELPDGMDRPFDLRPQRRVQFGDLLRAHRLEDEEPRHAGEPRHARTVETHTNVAWLGFMVLISDERRAVVPLAAAGARRAQHVARAHAGCSVKERRRGADPRSPPWSGVASSAMLPARVFMRRFPSRRAVT